MDDPTSTATISSANPPTPGVSAIGSTDEARTYNMQESLKRDVPPIALQDKNDIGMAARIDITDKQSLYSGDPALEEVMNGIHTWLCGDKSVREQFASRFGVLTKLFRISPPPILWDNPALIPLLGENACEDTAGRTWFYAPFYQKCLTDQAKGLEILGPLHIHEKCHTLLKHVHRMRNIPHFIRNKASHMPLNPMVAALFPPGTRFSPLFSEAEGMRKEDAKYKNLSEETCAQLMMSEILEKGTIEIDTLTLVDGKVDAQKTITANPDEVLKLGNITIVVEDKGATDEMDTLLDCGILKVKRVANQLATRMRPGMPSNGGNAPDTPFQIPCFDPKNLVQELLGENPFNSGSEGQATPAHVVDIRAIGKALQNNGMEHLAKKLETDKHDAKHVERAIERAIVESNRERKEIGRGYPGAHISDYLTEVVKPKCEINTTWDNMILEKVHGSGRETVRSMDEMGYLNYVSPEDMGMTEDDQVFYAGDLQVASKERFLFVIDSSMSVDPERAAMYLSCAISVRQNREELDPEVHIVSSDTVMRGEPIDLTDEEISDILANGFGMKGRGGTDIVEPLNQIMNYARENDIKYCGIAYVTDLGLPPFTAESLPDDLPPIVFVCIPKDHAENSEVVESLKKIGEVAIIEKKLHLGFTAADEKKQNRARTPHPRP